MARQVIADYLMEPVRIGGEPTTRAAFIHEMQTAKVPQRCIDLYLVGLARHMDGRKHTERLQ